MSPALLTLAAIVLALVLYLLFGGADFGGGVWDGLASGPRKREQRALVTEAIGPIWEANHVWLILAVVLLFTGFPKAFAAISIAFHIPLTLLLVSIVFRGSAFAFRTLDTANDTEQQRWGRVFAVASVLGPVLLGVVVAGAASGRVRYDGLTVRGGWFAPWTSPFAISCGLLCLALCAFLAATYLAHEAKDAALANDFRLRALGAGAAVFVCAAAALLTSANGAPEIRAGLTRSGWAIAFHLGTAVAALGSFAALFARRYALARYLAATQTALIVIGWAASQYPYLLVPDLTLEAAAAPEGTLRLVLGILAVGVPLLLPCLYLLYRVFKGERAFSISEE